MNKIKKEIKAKKWQEKRTDNIRLKKMLLKEVVILEKHLEALHETT